MRMKDELLSVADYERSARESLPRDVLDDLERRPAALVVLGKAVVQPELLERPEVKAAYLEGGRQEVETSS